MKKNVFELSVNVRFNLKTKEDSWVDVDHDQIIDSAINSLRGLDEKIYEMTELVEPVAIRGRYSSNFMPTNKDEVYLLQFGKKKGKKNKRLEGRKKSYTGGKNVRLKERIAEYLDVPAKEIPNSKRRILRIIEQYPKIEFKTLHNIYEKHEGRKVNKNTFRRMVSEILPAVITGRNGRFRTYKIKQR